MLRIYKTQRLLLGLVLITPLLGCSKLFSKVGSEVPPPAEQWAVVKISDGDTLKLRQTNGREMKVRLACIDSPELEKKRQLGQSFGKEARDNLQRLVNEADNWVEVSVVDKDRYGRAIAEIYTNVNGQQKFLNEEQVKAGFAYPYSAYLNKCANRIAIENAEAIARSNRLGVWSQPGLQKPWDFRKQQREKD